MKRLIFIFIPFVCYGQTFKGLQRTQGNTYTIKANELFESFPNSLGSNPVQNAIPDGWVAWFDPNVNVTLNGSTVSQWCDISNTYCVTQGTAANQPTYNTGSRPYMTYNGSTTFLSLSNFGGVGTNPVWSVYVIGNFQTTTGRTMLSYGTPSAQGTWLIYNGSASVNMAVTQFMTSLTEAVIGASVSNNILIGGEWNRTAGRAYASYNSNYRMASATITTTLTDWSSGTFQIGRYGTGGILNGTVYDIIFYNRSLSQAEYNSLYSFFKAKYSLP